MILRQIYIFEDTFKEKSEDSYRKKKLNTDSYWIWRINGCISNNATDQIKSGRNVKSTQGVRIRSRPKTKSGEYKVVLIQSRSYVFPTLYQLHSNVKQANIKIDQAVSKLKPTECLDNVVLAVKGSLSEN